MNIAFVIMNAGAGGHTRTAVSIAEALAKRGHTITFVIGADRDSPVLDNTSFEVRRVPVGKLGIYSQLNYWIKQLIEEKAIDVVHTFAYFGLTGLATACKQYGTPLWWTICGEAPLRPLDYDFLKFRSIITLSQEVKDGLVGVHGLNDDDVAVIPARINLQKVRSQVSVSEQRLGDFRKKYNIATDARIIFRIARVHASYENSLLQSTEVSKRLNSRGHKVCFVHIGYVQQEEVYRGVKATMAEANRAAGRTVAVTAQDEALEALGYLGMADLVIGTGRAAFEAMLAAKPTLVVGVNGFAGLISAETVEAIAHYNFSGRNVTREQSFEDSVNNITNVAEALFIDANRYSAVGRFGKRYVVETLDADIAAQKYERLYRTSMAHPVLPKKIELVRSQTLFKAKSLWRYAFSERSRAYVKALLAQRSPQER